MGVVRKFNKEKKDEQKLRRPNVYKDIAEESADIKSKKPNIILLKDHTKEKERDETR